MSLDLAWDELDGALAQKLVDILNKHLADAPRPSFIGPVEVTGLDFGAVCPDIEVVDLRDIYRDFLEDDEDTDSRGEAKKKAGKGGKDIGDVELEEDEYEWVPRRDVELAAAYDSPAYHPLTPHMRYGRAASVPDLADLRPGLAVSSSLSSNPAPTPVPDTNEGTHPNIQIHLRVLHHSDLRISITTSLLINYPAPLFLSLPIKLAVTGLELTGEVVLAYEGASSPRRVHFCLLDDLDPYGLAMGAGSSASRDGADPATKPLPIGQRLLPSIFIESEIGQADKHVLKNVTRVERFIQDVIRKTVEDELVFPNFHTIILGD
ncbi:uncharacterized protein FOMMEDRAFT_87497 [Fomitiporia mediterranea MF3/22]|uniref:uncharacterized protein n=1 Tax=Fomitiporia mediterranea (strain MF3/22) TaxID=694068 RepID=UPI00044075E5|nr:uncharacterized protein FOMMEDRAFT_87497 [Fomitiporia mediterranea MF3/22]EJD02187.1 hypothetical protein FOMMEDRAFT_87497 [Fomitiporia mediterranea MF3/22]